MNVLLYCPYMSILGSIVIAKKFTHEGTKDIINTDEINKTILDTFWSRLNKFSELLAVTTEDWRHFVLLCNLTSRIVVHIMMTAKAPNGMITLLTARVTLRTSLRLSVWTIPRSVLFSAGLNTIANLSMQYIGDTLRTKMTKNTMTMTDALWEVNILLTWKYKSFELPTI